MPGTEEEDPGLKAAYPPKPSQQGHVWYVLDKSLGKNDETMITGGWKRVEKWFAKASQCPTCRQPLRINISARWRRLMVAR